MYNGLFEGKNIVACDTETTGLNYQDTVYKNGIHPARPFAFSFYTYEGVEYYEVFDVDFFTREVKYKENLDGYFRLKKFFEDDSITKVFHNSNFDISMLNRIGIEVKGKVWDTLILMHVDNSSYRNYGLKPLSERLFGISSDDQKALKDSVKKARLKGKKLGWAISKDVEADYHLGDSKLVETYAVRDTERTMALWYICENKLCNTSEEYDKDYKALCDMEHTLLEVVRDMQDTGIRIDIAKCKELILYYTDVITAQDNRKAELGFKSLNPNSPKQMKEVFYNKLGLEKRYKKSKKKNKQGVTELSNSLTTDSDSLYKWSLDGVELAGVLLERNAAKHELNNFITTFLETSVERYEAKAFFNILHPSYKTCGPITARISCDKPNLMNISSNESANRRSETEYRSRECIICRDGKVLYFPDYSQIEIWGTAFRSNDKTMIDILLSGADIHTKTADSSYGHYADYEEKFKIYRKTAKQVNFGLPYGIGGPALAKKIGVDTKEGYRLIDSYWETYPSVRAYRDDLSAQTKIYGYITNAFGRKYHADPNAAYRAFNYDIQGSCAEVIKRAMINTWKYFKSFPGDQPKLLLTIHDELCAEVPKRWHNKKTMKNIVKCMQGDFHRYFKMPEPFNVSMAYTTTSWAEKQEVEL